MHEGMDFTAKKELQFLHRRWSNRGQRQSIRLWESYQGMVMDTKLCIYHTIKKPGQRVKRETHGLVGYRTIGSTTHLHYEVHKNQKWLIH
jgi:hypothetical protein